MLYQCNIWYILQFWVELFNIYCAYWFRFRKKEKGKLSDGQYPVNVNVFKLY